MLKINLIPENLMVSKSIAKVENVLKKLTGVFSALAFLSFFIFSILGIYLYFEINKREVSNTSLKSSIVALEGTEQKLYFVKDRLEKIDKIMANESVSEEMTGFGKIYEYSKEKDGVRVIEFSSTPKDFEMVLTFTKLSLVNEFIKYLESDKKMFQTVIISSMSLNSNTGYILNLELVPYGNKSI